VLRRKTPAAPAFSFPVFYDKSGKRLRRIILACIVLFCIVVAFFAWIIPSALAPIWTDKDDPGWARRVLTGKGTLPVVGDADNGQFTRIVSVERIHTGSGAPPGYTDDSPDDAQSPPPMPPVRLHDAVTGEYIRDATGFETEHIGDSNYATEHFGIAPDHTLMLTFDDGPDPIWTPEVLDVLARNHVPATFFVIGTNVMRNPGVFQRMIREGHMAGNHTMSHLEFDTQTDARNQEELVGTDRIMRSVANYASPLFRIPTGDPDHNMLAQLQSQQLGYLQVDMDVDTDDWRYKPGEAVPVPALDGRGHIVLMHDAGGNRAATVKMLQQLIDNAKAQGYRFTTLQPILPQHFVPRKNIPLTLADRATYFVGAFTLVAPGKALGFLFWFGTGSLVIVSMLYLLMALVSEWRQRRKSWSAITDGELPQVSVVLAAYNEAKVIERTLSVLRESEYPQDKWEVVAVDDGSKDDTAAILERCAREWSHLRVVCQPNSGKSSALNNGINHAHPDSTVIVTMDADTQFRKNTIRMLVRHFADGHRRLGAVAGHVKVGNRRNIVTAWQSLEYISGICVTRMAEMTMSAISIVPGACSAWRREALEKIGGFNDTTLAEDADATLTLQKLGYAVVNENAAIADTEAPETLRALARQRKRWMFGNVQALWKNRGMMFRPKYGMLGMLTMPYAALSLIFPVIFLPPTMVVAVITLAEGNWQGIAIFGAFVMATHAIIAAVGIAMARERYWHLLIVPIYRLIYEPLRAYLLYASVYRAIKGTVVAWDKLERRNSVAAKEVATC
jgi:biofilm PGA synthesis N-glycosyltransferase PgaC